MLLADVIHVDPIEGPPPGMETAHMAVDHHPSDQVSDKLFAMLYN